MPATSEIMLSRPLLHDELLTLLLMPLQVNVIIGRWQIHGVTVNTSIQWFQPLNIHSRLLALQLSVLSATTENVSGNAILPDMLSYKYKLDCAHRVQTSAKESNLNQERYGIQIQIFA